MELDGKGRYELFGPSLSAGEAPVKILSWRLSFRFDPGFTPPLGIDESLVTSDFVLTGFNDHSHQRAE
jgi:hypothetical protein